MPTDQVKAELDLAICALSEIDRTPRTRQQLLEAAEPLLSMNRIPFLVFSSSAENRQLLVGFDIFDNQAPQSRRRFVSVRRT
jgi:hypothetical protein